MLQPRATGNLYTGMTSQSFVKERQKRKDKRDTKAGIKADFAPDAHLVFGEIEKLRGEVSAELSNLIHVDTSETDVKSVVIGLRLADQKLVSLASRLNNILRLPVKKDETDANL